MSKLKKQNDQVSCKKEPLDIEGQRERFLKILDDLRDVLGAGLADLELAKGSYNILRSLQMLMWDKDKLDGELYEMFNQLENQVEQFLSD